MTETESWEMYAGHRDGEWFYAFPQAWYVREHGCEPLKVLVSLLSDEIPDEAVDGFGWVDTVSEDRILQNKWAGMPQMIWPRRFLMEMCFAYGIGPEIEAGKGRPVKLRIVERTAAPAPEGSETDA